MADPQGIMRFTGLKSIVGGTFTMTHGIEPSSGVLRVAPQDDDLEKLGTLTIEYDGEEWEFEDCVLTNLGATVSTSGTTVWSLTVHDRRWKWKFGDISGRFNRRDVEGILYPDPEPAEGGDAPAEGEGSDLKKNEKTVEELMEILLEAMEEDSFEIHDAPEDPRPTVDWDHANPADELAVLASKFGMIIQLDYEGTVHIYEEGSGEGLPNIGKEMNIGRGIQSKNKPSMIRLVGGETRFQSIFKCIPVGIDVDGEETDEDGNEVEEIKKLSELSYNPLKDDIDEDDIEAGKTGFHEESPQRMFGIEGTYKREGNNLKKRDLALKSVWRHFKIIELAEGGFQPMGEDLNAEGEEGGIVVSSLDQYEFEGGEIDYVYSYANDDEEDEDKKQKQKKQKPPTIMGQWYSWGNPPQNVTFGAYYNGDFEVDQEMQIVKFKDPVVLSKSEGSAGGAEEIWIEPHVFIRIAYRLRDQDGKFVRAIIEKEIGEPTASTGPLVLRDDALVETYKQRYKGDEPDYTADKVDNNFDKQVKEPADKLLEIAEKALEKEGSVDVSYAGLIKIVPDGSIMQVEWSFGEGAAATTRASRNTEFSRGVVGPNERRRRMAARRNENEPRPEDRGTTFTPRS